MLSFDPQRPGVLQRTLALSPPSAARVLCRVASAMLYVSDYDSVRSTCAPLIRGALDCSAWDSHRIALEATNETLVNYADVAFLLSRSDDQIARRCSKHCSVAGLDQVSAALASGNGVILFSAHFASMYLGMVQTVADPALRSTPLALLMRRTPGIDPLIEKLGRICGRQIYVIDVEASFVARELLLSLRKNHVIACMFDFFYESSSLVVSDFLGRPCATPAGIARLSVHSGCALIPQFTFRTRGDYRTTIWHPIVGVEKGSLDERTAATTDLMNKAIERAIRLYPGQWTFWRGLLRRREWAAALQSA